MHVKSITSSQIINTLLDLMSDSVVQVSDSAAWTVGRVCEHSPSTVLNEQYLYKLLQKLTEGLAGEPRVATNVCWVSVCVCVCVLGECVCVCVCVLDMQFEYEIR